LSALLLLAERLETTGGELLESVNLHLVPMYTAADASSQDEGLRHN
jgi:hypothetical protein